jgi:hypothetical protein
MDHRVTRKRGRVPCFKRPHRAQTLSEAAAGVASANPRIQGKDVESVELDLVVVLPAVQAIEVGDAVNA